MAAYRPRVVDSSEGAAGSSSRARIGPTDRSAHSAHDEAAEGDVAMTSAEPRTVRFETGLVKQAAGSSLLSVGGTKVLCAVHGPRAIKRSSDFADRGTLTCSVRYAPFSQYAKHGVSARQAEAMRIKNESSISNAVLRAVEGSVRLETFPKSLVEIHIVVLSDDGGIQAAAVNSATLALADGGVELLDLVSCAQVGLLSSNSSPPQFVPDPDTETLDACSSSLLMAYMPATGTVSDYVINGALPYNTAGEASKACFLECAKMHKLLKDHLIRSAVVDK